MTERLHFHFSLLCIGEGHGNPLQCSCLENPKDGVAQSRTWLKWLSSKESYNAGNTGPIPGSGRSPAEENDNPLQYSCLDNSMNKGAWWVIVHGVAKSLTWLTLSQAKHHWRKVKWSVSKSTPSPLSLGALTEGHFSQPLSALGPSFIMKLTGSSHKKWQRQNSNTFLSFKTLLLHYGSRINPQWDKIYVDTKSIDFFLLKYNTQVILEYR